MENEKRMKKRIQKLSDCTLARLLLRRLWQWIDSAGGSMGRTMRGGLLEEVNRLISLPYYIQNIDIAESLLLDEAQKRVNRKKKIKFKLEALLPLHRINRRSLAHLLLLKLKEWYDWDEKEAPKRGEFPLSLERRFVDLSIPLIPPTQNYFHLYPLKWETILGEARKRRINLEFKRLQSRH